MEDSPTTGLLVDIETGRILSAPDKASVSSRWVESHPFAEEFQAPTGWFVVVGPDAARVARGFGGDDKVIYEVIDEIPETGELRLRKES